MGVVEQCGLGAPIDRKSQIDVDAMRADCSRSNASLLEQLRSDEYEDELMNQTLDDAKLGRMTSPRPGGHSHAQGCSSVHVYCALCSRHVPVNCCALDSVRLHPRFGIQQGTRYKLLRDALVFASLHSIQA